jgi:nucleoside-diphosphate-sugar epimerase
VDVVVIGATGNVGLALVERLSASPEVDRVLGIARRIPNIELPKVRWHAADIVTDDLDGPLRGADVVVHLAWLIQPTRELARLWEVNVRGTVRVVEAVARAGVPAFVYASSVGAYSPGPSDRFVDESWPTHGVATSAYSREKAYTERVLDAFEGRNPRTRVVRMRPGLIFAAETASHVRRLFLGGLVPGAFVRPSLLPLLPDIRGLAFQAVHTRDVADAYHAAVVGDASGPFNLAADPVLGIEQLAAMFDAKRLRTPRVVARAAVRASWTARLQPVDPGWLDLALESPLLDSSRARAELGWRPRYAATDALRELLAAMQEGAGAPTVVLEPDQQRSTVTDLRSRQGAREAERTRAAGRR